MARVTGSHLIAKALKLEGVYNIFTLAGDHVLPVLDVMADDDFRFIDTRHEQAAVHMADAYGRITGQLGVCMYTTPGFANAIPGLTNAMHSESPCCPSPAPPTCRNWAGAPCRKSTRWAWRRPPPRNR